jgi:hypothetical protein
VVVVALLLLLLLLLLILRFVIFLFLTRHHRLHQPDCYTATETQVDVNNPTTYRAFGSIRGIILPTQTTSSQISPENFMTD